MNLEEAFSKYTLGVLRAEELPKIARDALQAGYDSPALRVLSGLGLSDHHLIPTLFTQAVTELNVPVLTIEQSGMTLARIVATQVVNAVIEPYEGARRIWREIYEKIPELARLRPFVGYASEYEDDESHRDEYSELILAECRKLIEDVSSGAGFTRTATLREDTQR